MGGRLATQGDGGLGVSGYFRHQWRDHVRECTDLPPGAVLLALELHSHMNDRGTCRPGHQDMMNHTHLKHSAITKWLGKLREALWIEVLERGNRGPGGQNRASLYQARIPEHECQLTPAGEALPTEVSAPSLGENPTPTPALVNESRVHGNGQPIENHERGTGSQNENRVLAEPKPQIRNREPRFGQSTTADADPYTLDPLLNPPDEPAMQPLMSKEDPRIQLPLDRLCELSEEWRKSRKYVEMLALHTPFIDEALQAALETEQRKPGSILGATRWTRKVAHRIGFNQGHQGQREAERQLAEGSPSLPVPQFREPEEVVAE